MTIMLRSAFRDFTERRMKHINHKPTKSKARKMLKHGSVRGKPLSKRQRGLFGAIIGGTSTRRSRYS